MTVVCVTVDVEGDYGTSSLHGVDTCMPWLLDLLAAHDARATFFVVGEVAAARPRLVRAWADAGHEVASHGHTHRPLTQLAAADVARELATSRHAVEQASGQPCAGFRAPYFACPDGLGARLADAGYRWSSSHAPLSPVAGLRVDGRRGSGDRGLPELAVPRLMGLPLPDGLSWRRQLWPLSGRAPAPPVFYLHPYELAEDVAAFGHPAHWRPLMLRRRGTYAREVLATLLGRWRSSGARFTTVPEALGVGG